MLNSLTTQQESQQSHLSETFRLVALDRNSHNLSTYRNVVRFPMFCHEMNFLSRSLSLSDMLSNFSVPKRRRLFDFKISHLLKRAHLVLLLLLSTIVLVMYHSPSSRFSLPPLSIFLLR